MEDEHEGCCKGDSRVGMKGEEEGIKENRCTQTLDRSMMSLAS